MKARFSLSLLLIASLVLVTEAQSQACGYIYAKFYVVDGNGKFVRTARLELLSSNGRSIAYDSEKEISVSTEDGAFIFAHGLCGAHHNVQLVITDAGFERFDTAIALPLNSGQSEHVFKIRLKRKGSDEVPEIETWGRLVGEASDNQGNPLADVQIVLTDRNGSIVRAASSIKGVFSLAARPGQYSLEAKAPNGDKIRYEDITMASGPRMQDISLTFNTKPKQNR